LALTDSDPNGFAAANDHAVVEKDAALRRERVERAHVSEFR